MNDPEKRFDEIATLFYRAEDRIKTVERIGEGLIFPAVNQLRYVAYHLLNANTTKEQDEFDHELNEAIYHCRRAISDASEIGIIHFLEEIEIFEKDYDTITVTDIIQNYVDICEIAEQANAFIEERSRKSVKENSEATTDYEKADYFFKELAEIVKTLKASRKELNKKRKWNLIIFTLALVSTFAAILGVIIAMLNC